MKKLLLFLSLAFSLNAFSQVPSYVPTSGLVGWWPFTGNAIDSSGNGNNGTVTGATLTTDRFGNSNSAYYFSSAGCATRIDAILNTSSIITGVTISVWILRVGDGCIAPRFLEFYVLGDGPGSAQWGWDNTGFGNIGSVTSTSAIIATAWTKPLNNVWTNLVYTNNGSFGKFYQDGVLFNTLASSGNPILSGNAAFGRMNSPAYDAFNGNLDDIGIWNRALDSCEVKDLYFASLGNCSSVGMNEVSQTNIFTVYPNPTNSTLTINTKANYSSIQIVNTIGQVVFTKEKSASLNLSSLPSGIYFIQLVDNKGSVIGKEKFVKE